MGDVTNTEQKSEQNSSIISRRNFLRKGLLLGLGVVLGSGTSKTLPLQTEKSNDPPEKITENILEDSTTENTEKELTDRELLNKILETPLELPERENFERNYLVRAKTLEQIDQGFICLADPDFRAQLLDLRWEERVKNNAKLKPLSPELISQSIKQGIHPEVFAVCFDAREKAIIMAQKIFNKSKSEIEKIMPNIGEMATRICSETGLKYPKGKFKDLVYGFINIGHKSALSQTNTDVNYLVNTKGQLEELMTIVGALTNLNIKEKIYPGSTPRKQGEDSSGGAVGPLQFMPPTALDMCYFIFDKTGQKLNFLDLEEASIMSLIYVIKSPEKWNNDQKQIEEIRAGGQAFLQKK